MHLQNGRFGAAMGTVGVRNGPVVLGFLVRWRMNSDGAIRPDQSLASLDEAGWFRLFAAIGEASLLVYAQGKIGPALLAEVSAEDVVQEALMSVWRSRATLRWQGPGALRAWVLRAIENRIKDAAERARAIKRGGRHGVPAGQIAAEWEGADRTPPPWLGSSTTPSGVAHVREEASRIRAALAALPEEYGVVVRLRIIEQKELHAIAEHLDLTIATVRHRLRRGAEMYARLLATRRTCAERM